MTMHFHVYASPEYLKKYGLPEKPADLADHMLIVYGEDMEPPVANVNWLLEAGRKPNDRDRALLKVNNIYGIYRAVQSGVGIASLPDYTIRQASQLVRILPELEGPSYDAYFVYPAELRHSKRIIVFRDYLIRKIAESQF